MAVNQFSQSILDLNFTFIDESETSGVLLTSDYQKTATRLGSPEILFALETAKLKFSADAVYFRFFQDGRAAVPQLYLFDYTYDVLTDDDRQRIHKQMWNGYQVPAYVIIEKSQVSFFDSREKPKDNLENYAGEIIKLSGSAIQGFNAKGFDDGLFWEEEAAKNHFRFEQSATRDLIRGLKEVFKSFQEKSGLDRHIALKLLVQCLLIKYLEERDEESQSGYFAGTYFKRNFGCDNFCDTIRNGKLLNLLDQLAKDFNGKIFEWDSEEEAGQRLVIQRSEVNSLADYLDGKIKNNQFVLWRLYSFSHLPVEVISSVYEELLTDSKDIVYTPEMIVSTLVDECMPLKKPQSDFKLIDVSCGSGIFLVKAYKRLVQWWRYSYWLKTGELVKPPLNVLKDLLVKSIHGLDIEQDAVRLSVFSLALAILDEVNLDPPTWGKLKFPDLSNNILTSNFFHFISDEIIPDFDLVIGNPPFNLPPVNGKEPDRERYFKTLKEDFGYSSAIKIPDENPALHFLVQSMKLLNPGALLCLIQPSGPLFYQRNKIFKEAIFDRYNLLQVLDLTKLSDKLWGKTNVSTAAVFIENAIPDESLILHLIANRNISNTNRIFLEFDHYDFHFIDKREAWDEPFVWKANLLGGGRITQLIKRLSLLPTLGSFLKLKKKNHKWVYGEGFIKGKKDIEILPHEIHNRKGGYKKFDYLNNSECIDSKKFTETGIGETFQQDGVYYQWGRMAELFQPPLLLIKNGIGKNTIPMHFSTKPLSYKDRIFGIHAPSSDESQLKAIHDYFVDYAELIRFYIASTSAEILVNRATAIFSQDILHVPYIEQTVALLSEADQIVVKDTLYYYLNVFVDSLFEKASTSALKSFIEIFSKTLNSVYQTENKAFNAYKLLDAGKYYAIHFTYAEQGTILLYETVDDLEAYIESVIPSADTHQRSTHIQKIMKLYGEDSIILVKPKQLRYWLGSIALRDADETYADYVNTRYDAQR